MASILSILAVLFGGVWFLIQQSIAPLTVEIRELKERVGRAEKAVIRTDKRIEDLLSKALDRALQTGFAAKNTAHLREALEYGRFIIETARETDTSLDQRVVAEFGRRAATAQITDAEVANVAWTAASEALRYRSALNAKAAPDTSRARPLSDVTPGWKADLVFDKDTRVVLTFTGGAVPINQAAGYEDLGTKQAPDVKVGPAFLVITGPGMARLDGKRLKNVLFRDMDIWYDGGRVTMETVYFVNCTFHIRRNQRGQGFNLAVLQAPQTDFQTP